MKDQKITIQERAAVIFLSFFGSGFFPKAPGTAGSVATIPLMYLIFLAEISLLNFILATTALTIISCFIAEYIQQKRQLHDPQWIVMDEVLGMLVTWAFIYPRFDFISCFVLFILFRFFDIVKFWPASYFDKKVTHGSGTILDDIISGIFAGLSLLLLQKFQILL